MSGKKESYPGIRIQVITEKNADEYRQQLSELAPGISITRRISLPSLKERGYIILATLEGKPVGYCDLISYKRPGAEHVTVVRDIFVAEQFQKRLSLGKLLETKAIYLTRNIGGGKLIGFPLDSKEAIGVGKFRAEVQRIGGLSARGWFTKSPFFVSGAGVFREEHLVGGKPTRVGGEWKPVKSPGRADEPHQSDFSEAKELSLPREADVAKLRSLQPVAREKRLLKLRTMLRRKERWNELAALEEAMPVPRRRIRRAYRRRSAT